MKIITLVKTIAFVKKIEFVMVAACQNENNGLIVFYWNVDIQQQSR
ncbi:hypothetical protein A8V23_05025 [Yersinia pestis]|uniref:Uncharacterized protein n=3 Tax=Yersinia pseudotuberculosis complex TaxID=1649845 RepID=A0A0U1QWL4_YERP3|nr:hypothetical protein YpsIP31758_2599 [Yersinia pseudotuberculosis IP 31758]ABX86911.1 hypothetical protein YpAngola_A1608 [Yersinia pestis Angola]ADV99342.1 hypothetical protein YPC_2803 [Yersinia pestis biovar Medievalis str. Harbin 35]AEL74412.1 hypothetical protein A1122_18990 [Yersinia pestis A1122]ANW13494.1 hypothetical protein BAY22_05695 [Yersinia pestis]EDR31704.1 hypothetical protein YPIP275_3814 [Yersinia pestis biovar Orientalis str. IP275]EDR40854.1 hypothetical protein YpF199